MHRSGPVLLVFVALVLAGCGLGDAADPVLLETVSDIPYEEALGEDAISSKPFTGPSNNGLIGLGRRIRTGLFARATIGTSHPAALTWLAAQQHPDGGWTEPGLTGHVLLAYFAGGYTNRGRHAHAKAVSRGLRFLKNRQGPYGWFGPEPMEGREWPRDLRQHGPACAAMVEAWAQTNSPLFRSSAIKGLDALASACALEDGGLREPRTAYAALLALLSAKRVDLSYVEDERTPPFRVNAERFGALARQRFLPRGASQEDVAIAVLAREVFNDPADVEAKGALEELARTLRARPILWTTDLPSGPPIDWALVHAAIQVTPDAGDQRHQQAARSTLLEHQQGDDANEEHRGSWAPSDLPGNRDGRVRLTALSVASLWRILEP